MNQPYKPKIPRDVKLFTIISLVVILVGLLIFRHYYSGTIIINSNPAGVVLINGKEVSGTEFKLLPGDYQIEIVADGYIPFSQTAHIGTGLRTEVNAALKPLPEPAKISDNASYLENVNNILYFGCGGAICSYSSADKNLNTLSDAKYPDLAGLKINPQNSQLVLVKKGTNWGLLDFKRYDLLNQSWQDFGANISDVVYNPSADRIIYFTKENNLRLIKKANLNNGDSKNLGLVGDESVNNPKLQLINDQSLLLVDKDVFAYDLGADQVNKLTTSGNIASAYWTPDGKIIYSTLSPLPDQPINYRWAIMDADGKNKQNFDFQAASPLLVFYDEKNLLLFSGSTFDKINLVSGNKISYYFKGEIKPLDLVINTDKKSIFYISDGKLWELTLISQ